MRVGKLFTSFMFTAESRALKGVQVAYSQADVAYTGSEFHEES